MIWKEKHFTFIVSAMICFALPFFGTANAIGYRNHIEHSGDLNVSGNDVLVIDSTDYLQYGNVTIEENGNLTIVDSRFSMAGENSYISLLNNGTLKVANSELTSRVHVLQFHCCNNSRILYEDTAFSFWGSTVIELWGNSAASIEDSTQREWVQVETHNTTTVTVKNSTIAMIQCSGSSKVLLQDSKVTHGSSCTQYARLILRHSSFQEWLSVEDSSNLEVAEHSELENIWSSDSSNSTINNSYVKWIELSDSSGTLLTNNSNVEILQINLPSGSPRISSLRNGYVECYTLDAKQTGLSLNINKCSVGSFDLNVGSVFLEDSSVGQLTVSRYGIATICTSEVRTLHCDENSLVVLWNSKALSIDAYDATIRHFSTVDSNLFYITTGIAITLALALAGTISMILRTRARKS